MGLLITALILAAHVVFARAAGGLWRDESSLIQLATLPVIAQVWGALQYDTHPILMALLLRGWTAVGWGADHDLWLRVLGSLMGASLVGAVWLNVRRFAGVVPAVSLALLCLNPLAIRYTDSIRPYGLGAVVTLLLLVSVWQATRARTPIAITAAIASGVACVHCTYQGPIFVFSICVAGLIMTAAKRDWTGALVCLGVGAATALSFLPYVWILRGARDWLILIQMPAYTFAQFLQSFRQVVGAPIPLIAWGWGAGAVTAMSLLVLGTRSGRNRPRRDADLYLASVMLVAPLMFAAFFRVAGNAAFPWHFLPLMALLAVCIDVALAASLPFRFVRVAAAACLVILTGSATVRELQTRQTNIDVVAATLRDSAAPGDLIIVNPWFFGISFHRYYSGSTPWSTVPSLEDLKIHRHDLLKEQMSRPEPLRPLLENARQALAGGHRVWVVGDLAFPPPGQPAPSLSPAPNGPSGWHSGPYVHAWSMQLGYFLRSHVVEGHRVAIPADLRVNPLEDVSLMVFKGWRS